MIPFISDPHHFPVIFLTYLYPALLILNITAFLKERKGNRRPETENRKSFPSPSKPIFSYLYEIIKHGRNFPRYFQQLITNCFSNNTYFNSQTNLGS